MERRKDRLRLAVLMLCMGIAAVASVWLEGLSADAARYADIKIQEIDGERYLFLPAWANRAAEEKKYEQEEGLTIMQSQNLPAIEIWTQSGSLDTLLADKNASEPARMRIVLPDGTESYAGNIEELRTRGNSTWALDKKPFQLKLSWEADLFGMGEAKTWLLLANGFDQTGIRNSIALEMAQKAGLAYTPEGILTDLYCNGLYQGTYLLSEKVQARKNRVDIGNGFLIERELQERYEIAYYLEGQAGFCTERGEYYLIRYPENPTDEQIEWIRQLVQDAEDAIYAADGCHPKTGQSYTDYIDQSSFVKKYLLEEITKNYDGGVTSAFYYVPEGEERLYAGPAWDYDVSFGNCRLDEMNSDPQGVTELTDHLYGTRLYSRLMDQEDFREAVFTCYEQVYLPVLDELLEGGIDRMAKESRASMEMNDIRWAGMENRHAYYHGYEDNLRYLKFFIRQRRDYLTRVWVGGEIRHRVTLYVSDMPWRRMYVQDEALLGELPIPVLEGQLFEGWYTESGQKYDPYRPIYEETGFYARWRPME